MSEEKRNEEKPRQADPLGLHGTILLSAEARSITGEPRSRDKKKSMNSSLAMYVEASSGEKT
jgi:hypothetical protein